MNYFSAHGQPGLLEISLVGLNTARCAPIAHMALSVGVKHQRYPSGFRHQLGGQVILCWAKAAIHNEHTRCPRGLLKG